MIHIIKSTAIERGHERTRDKEEKTPFPPLQLHTRPMDQ